MDFEDEPTVYSVNSRTTHTRRRPAPTARVPEPMGPSSPTQGKQTTTAGNLPEGSISRNSHSSSNSDSRSTSHFTSQSFFTAVRLTLKDLWRGKENSRSLFRVQLTLSFIFPLVLFLAFAIIILANLTTQLQAADQMKWGVGFTVILENMVHESQKERGLSGTFVGSGGLTGGDALTKQRQLADARRQEFEDYQTDGDTDRLNALKDSCPAYQTAIDTYYNQWLYHRQQIDALAITSSEAVDFYSAMDLAYIDIGKCLLRQTKSDDVQGLFASYIHFMLGKEYTGQERAVGTAIFAGHHFAPGRAEVIANTISNQRLSFLNFQMTALDDQIQRYKDLFIGQAFTDIILRDEGFLLSNNDAALYNTTSLDWYGNCTAKINLLKVLEDELSDALLTKGTSTVDSSVRYILGVMFGVVAIVCISTYLLIRIMRKSTAAMSRKPGKAPKTSPTPLPPPSSSALSMAATTTTTMTMKGASSLPMNYNKVVTPISVAQRPSATTLTPSRGEGRTMATQPASSTKELELNSLDRQLSSSSASSSAINLPSSGITPPSTVKQLTDRARPSAESTSRDTNSYVIHIHSITGHNGLDHSTSSHHHSAPSNLISSTFTVSLDDTTTPLSLPPSSASPEGVQLTPVLSSSDESDAHSKMLSTVLEVQSTPSPSPARAASTVHSASSSPLPPPPTLSGMGEHSPMAFPSPHTIDAAVTSTNDEDQAIRVAAS